ncbi:MAG: hypothetical protein FWB96_11770 [Defluviitaleaceae bacterium]|nr:hypothetical protein [Defluviitaleaceae bacterium]MCL2263754.1 hypothetical protein [Defluviitaleaceae bacterium]
MKDNYDFSKMKNVRRNPYAEQLNTEGHTTIIHTLPTDFDIVMDDEVFDIDLSKEAI